MKKMIYCIMSCFAFCVLSSCAIKTEEKSESYTELLAKSEMKRYPELWMIENKKKPNWGYTHGLIAKSMLELWKHTGDSTYYNYAKAYADSLIDSDGKIKTMKYLSYNIDNINTGKILFDFYEQTQDTRYKIAMDTLRKQMTEHPRTKEGGFWHKLRYPHQLWLDGIYMASPYLVQYGTAFGDTTVYNDVINQITLIANKTYDPKTGLYYHGWDESREQAWADKKMGNSPNFWSRSIGWYAMALVDVLDYLPESTKGRNSILSIIKNLAADIVKYQDSKTGIWYQVTDQPEREGNYLESSGSCMFTYFLCKSVNKGYIENQYKLNANKAFEGIIKEFIKKEENGTYSITNCCEVAGLGGDKVYRDGSFEYYISEPVIDNDPKSVGSFILAAIEYENMNK